MDGSMIEFLDAFGRFRRAANRVALHRLKPLGLGTKQAGMLRYLLVHERCSHADLARHTITDPAATGRILDALAAKGHVRRAEDPGDRRRWVLSLTPRGRRLARAVETAYRGLAAELLKPLPPDRRSRLADDLDVLARAAEARAERVPRDIPAIEPSRFQGAP